MGDILAVNSIARSPSPACRLLTAIAFRLKTGPGNLHQVLIEKRINLLPVITDLERWGSLAFHQRLSLGTLLGATYGYVENTFTAKTPLGELLKTSPETVGQVVDWNVHTWTFQPSADLRYRFPVRNNLFEFSSNYTHLHTEQFSGSSSALNVEGDSQYWQNKIDVNIPLPISLWNSQLHTGGNFSCSDLFGEVSNALQDDYFYTVHARLVADVYGRKYFWKTQHIGLGGSYNWSDNVSGWSAGINISFKI